MTAAVYKGNHRSAELPIEAAPAPQGTFRRCTSCWAALPVKEFRFHRRATAQREWECRSCNSRRARLRRFQRQGVAIDSFVAEAAGERKNAKLVALVEAMLARLGGPDEFAERWHQQIVAATIERPGSRTTLKAFEAILSLVALVEQQNKAPSAQAAGEAPATR